MLGLLRLLAVLSAAAVCVALAGSAHSPLTVLAALAGALILALLGIVALWSRPLVAAALGWLWLTGAFAAGTFLAGGVDGPGAPAFAGRSSADSAAVVVAAAAAFAAVAGAITMRSAPARIAVVLLALYAIVPTAASVGHGGLTAAFSNAPLAQTRGTYAGVELLLPLAALAALVFALVFVARKRGARAALAFVTALALLSAANLGASAAGSAGLPTITAFERRGAAAASGSAAGPSPQVVSAQLERMTQALRPEDFMLSERAKTLPTVDAAFAWVRDTVRFEAYDGILRGAPGTLSARAGNAPDRAMLLAALLQQKKIPVRLATGRLPEAQAERLYQRMFEPPPNATSPPSISSEGDGLHDRILARAHRDDDAIRAALGNAAPTIAPQSHDDVLKEIERHAWVQANQDGRWVDLDPSFADSAVGRTYATAEQTYDAPPDVLMQKVTIRVTTDTLQHGALVKDVALEVTVPAYTLFDTPVYLAHTPPGMGKIFGSGDAWQPVLDVGGTATAGKPIAFTAGASAAGAATANPVAQAAGAFGTPAPAPATNPGGPAFVAEWLEFEIAFPDGRKDVTRRVLIDRGGTAWRHAATLDPSKLKDLARNADGLIAPQTLYNVWFSAGKHDLLAFATAARSVVNGVIPSRDPSSPSFEEQAWPLGIRDLGWLIASDHVLVPSLNDTPGVRYYADSPRIFVWSIGPDPTGKSGKLSLESDLRRDTLRAVARDAAGAATIARHKLWFGALEGALETEMSSLPNPDPANPLVTTSMLTESGRLVVFRPGDTVSASDPETRARAQGALAAGDTLVVPSAVLAGGVSGWWQIAHGDGTARAVLGDDLNAGGGIFGPNNGSPGYGKGVCTVLCDDNLNPIGYGKKPPPKSTGGGEMGEYAFNLVYISAAAVPTVRRVSICTAVAVWAVAGLLAYHYGG
jgi:hypothetical protein